MTLKDTQLTRRSLLAGTAAIGASALTGFALMANDSAQTAYAADGDVDAAVTSNGLADSADAKLQYGFSMDLYHCVACGKCIEACRYYNQLSDDTPDRRRIVSVQENALTTVHVSTSCMHCKEPSCMTVCPAGAISKGAGGIVTVDKDRCIGCKYCYQACPFSVPRYNSIAMDKCDCCTDIGLPVGETPYCVRACIFDALHYGPLEELVEQAGDAGEVLEASTEPSCVLIKA